LKKFIKWHYRDLDLLDFLEPVLRRQRFDVNTRKVNEGNLATEEDIEKMLRFAVSYKEKAYLFLIFESGARPQEILDLRWKDIIFKDDYADVNLFSEKTKRQRPFPVNKARKYLWEWKQNYFYSDLKEGDYVFPSRFSRDEPMTSANGNKILRNMAKKAGVNKNLWNYLFRHSKATRLYEELPTPIVEQLMGHKDMYRTYAHISTEKARKEMLSKIYKLNELPESKKHELELKLEKQNQELENVKKDNEKMRRENREIKLMIRGIKESIDK
jgi:integrase